ncbi:hypothetical protein AA313_de0201843 [Arthrobotrys entomopaga]|nr:hypothetical protein AA313_de0201843 [Arthrobotrys entomopaga]
MGYGYELAGRNVLVTGGSRGIGEAISERFAAQGSNLILNYISNKERADALKTKLLEKYLTIKVVAIQADVGKKEECENLVKQSIEALGGLDVICSNAGWTKFAQFGDLDALSEEDWDKCYAVNVKANIWLLNAAKPTFNANPDGGSLTICASIAIHFIPQGTTTRGSSMAYAVSKSAALHLMRCLAASQGPKIRVNAVCPGLVLTEWGDLFPQSIKDAYVEATQTKKIIKVEDVADAFIFCAKNVAMTGQKIIIDGGVIIQP